MQLASSHQAGMVLKPGTKFSHWREARQQQQPSSAWAAHSCAVLSILELCMSFLLGCALSVGSMRCCLSLGATSRGTLLMGTWHRHVLLLVLAPLTTMPLLMACLYWTTNKDRGGTVARVLHLLQRQAAQCGVGCVDGLAATARSLRWTPAAAVTVPLHYTHSNSGGGPVAPPLWRQLQGCCFLREAVQKLMLQQLAR